MSCRGMNADVTKTYEACNFHRRSAIFLCPFLSCSLRALAVANLIANNPLQSRQLSLPERITWPIAGLKFH